MPETNGTIIKTIASAGAACIIGILFYYFMQAHFSYLKESNGVIRQSIETQQKLIGVVEQLNQTINNKTVQAELRAVSNINK